MAKRVRKMLVIAIVFAMTVVNYGLPLQAIASEGGFFFGTSLFKRDEMSLDVYFDGDPELKIKETDVNTTAKLTVEVTPLIEGYLKSGLLKLNLKNGHENNFRISGISVESETSEYFKGLEESAEAEEKLVDQVKGVETPSTDAPKAKSSIFEGITNIFQDVIVDSNEGEDVNPEEITVEPEETVTEDVEATKDAEENDDEGLSLGDVIADAVTENVEVEEEKINVIDEVVVLNDNEIELKNIVENTKIHVDLAFKSKDAIHPEDLYSVILVSLEGSYINKKLETVETLYEDEVTLGWFYDSEVEVHSNYVKVSPFAVGENLGTIVSNEIIVKRNSEDAQTLPIKQTNLKIKIPMIYDKLPIAVDVMANKLMATAGQELNQVTFTQDNWKYNPENGELEITVKNDIAKVSNGEDKFTIVTRYEDYVNEDMITLDSIITLKVETYSSNQNKVQETTLQEVQEKEVDAGEIITYSVDTTEAKLNKGRINANFTSEILYETEFSTIVNVNLLTSDLLEEITIEGTKDTYKDIEGNELDATRDIEYKGIKFQYAEIKELLEKGSTIDILDGSNNVIYTLSKDNTKEQTDAYLEIDGRIKNAKVRINGVKTNGNISIEFVKVIGKSSHTLKDFSTFDRLTSTVKAFVKYVSIEEMFTLKELEVDKYFTESYTKADFSINKEHLSTVKDNANVELKIVLNNHVETSDLYKNPVFEIVFPKHIKDVKIQSMNLLNEDGLRVNDFKTYERDGQIRLKLELAGSQKSFSEAYLTNGTNIIINANITVDEVTPRKKDEIKLYYYNEAVTNYQTQTEWNIENGIPFGIAKETNGYDAVVVEYDAPVGLIAINGIENYDGKSSILKSVKQGEVIDMLAVGKSAQIAQIKISTLNNTGNDCSDLIILGRTPFEGNKNIETGEDLGTTLTVPMHDFIIQDPENPINAKIYYSTKEDANELYFEESNGWIENIEEIEDITQIKSFLIVPEGTLKAGEMLNYTYNIEIPANLPYEGKMYGTFTAYYDNNTEYALVEEISTADKVGLETDPGPRIESEMTVDIGENAEIKEGKMLTYFVKVRNTGTVTAEGVSVIYEKPDFGQLIELINPGTNSNTTETPGYSELPEYKECDIGRLEPGQEATVSCLVKIGELIPNDESEDAFKEISYKANIKVDNLAIEKETNEIKNKVKKANMITNVEIGYSGQITDKSTFPYIYVLKNTSGKKLNNVKIECILPDELNYEFAKLIFKTEEEIIPEFDETSNKLSISIKEVKENAILQVHIQVNVGSGSRAPVSPVLLINADEIPEEKGMEVFLDINAGIIDATLESSNRVTVKERELVEFRTTIANSGKSDASKINVKVKPSENLTDVSVYYVGSIEGVGKLEEGNWTALLRDLRAGKSITFVVSGYAADLDEAEKIIQSSISIEYGGREVAAVMSDSLTIIEDPELDNIPDDKDNNGSGNNSNNNGTGSSDNKDDDLKPDDKNNNNQNINKPSNNNQNTNNNNQSNNNNNNQTNNNSNTNNNVNNNQNGQTNTKKETYSLSGTIWIDTNENGQKDKTESFAKGIRVNLQQSGETLKSTQTNTNGFYNFSNIEPGKYTVIFEYDGEKYGVTTYNQNDSNTSIVSKGIEVNKGKSTSNEIEISNFNIENINLGLVVKEKFNLAINKYVTEAVVNIKGKVERFDFDDLDLAKIEIAAKDLSKATVDLKYKMVIENKGNVEGYAVTINDYMPEGMTFDEDENEGWYLGKNGLLYNNSLERTLIKPGEKVELGLVLTKEMTKENTGTLINKVLIAGTRNSKELIEDTINNMATQETLILVKTGYTVPMVAGATMVFIITILIVNKNKFILTKDKNYGNEVKVKKKLFRKMYK